MRLNELSQVTKVEQNDLVLIWAAANSQARTAPFSLMTDAAQAAVYERLGLPGAAEELGFARSGVNEDITRLTGIITSAILTDANSPAYIGTFGTTTAATNNPEASVVVIWNAQLDTNNRAQLGVSLISGKLYWRKMSIVSGSTGTWSAWSSALAQADFTVANITGTGATGRALMAAADAPTARTALGFTALGSNLVLSSTAATARSNLASGAMGDQIFTAATAAAVRTLIATTFGGSLMTQADAAGTFNLLGVTSMGRNIITTGDANAAQTSLGGGTAGRAVFVSESTDNVQTAIGATVTGKALILAANAAAAQTAIGATTVGKALIVAADAAAGRTAISAAVDAAPTATVRGTLLQATATADLTAAPTMADFNALLAKLRSSGLMAAA